ncbi:hypothetical protein SAMN04487977_101531 [Treponema bryantii]|uniref:Uncharacterized protein n=1 Tax=Treponema bryantii TaxID=163 RepID=A0A1H9B0C7_9SPIR|nr:hypothetical protein [Treponema bryantii]SEP82329.1 hypothetical protein SAMN04487977_101531 [Treponema bryantii]
MIKVYVTNHIYGNRYEKYNEMFGSMNELINWLLSEQWRYFYHTFTKGKTYYTVKNSYSHDVGSVLKETDREQNDDFSFDISTFDHFGVYKKTISRIDVDGLCILNREWDKNDKETVVVTNTCIETLVKPMMEKWSSKQEIKYAV